MTQDLSALYEGQTVLVLKGGNGKRFTEQVGGKDCLHPIVFGEPKCLGTFGQDFNDCTGYCTALKDSEVLKQRLAKELNQYFSDRKSAIGLEIEIDIANLGDLVECWWPVRVKQNDSTWREGIISTNMSCD